MKHLFIINPLAAKVKGRVSEFKQKIDQCRKRHSDASFFVHVTRWCRDAVGFVRKYVESTDEVVRVHSVGGSGTLYEVVNGIIGAPNAEVAVYPLGSSNSFVQYFMRKNMRCFEDFESQITSDTISIDALTDGTNYGIANFLVGIEAEAFIAGSEFTKKVRVLPDLWTKLSAVVKLIARKSPGADYRITLDDSISVDGRYLSILTANTPCYQKKMNPAIDAHPNDGVLDIYTAKSASRRKYIKAVRVYTSGNYKKMPQIFSHYTCKKIEIECDSVMHTSFDGEVLFAKKIAFSVVADAIRLVVPKKIDLTQIPEKYQG